MKSRYEELTSRAKDRLHVGQILYLAPLDAPGIKAKDISLIKGTISEIPADGSEITAVLENGQKFIVGLEICAAMVLYLGMAELKCGSRFWVFLSEPDFWEWWEWYILSCRLSLPCSCDDIGYTPSRKKLHLCRLLYDILVNQNPNYQNRSCEGCAHSDNHTSPNAPCRHCIRMIPLEDHWQGGVSALDWLLRNAAEGDKNET